MNQIARGRQNAGTASTTPATTSHNARRVSPKPSTRPVRPIGRAVPVAGGGISVRMRALRSRRMLTLPVRTPIQHAEEPRGMISFALRACSPHPPFSRRLSPRTPARSATPATAANSAPGSSTATSCPRSLVVLAPVPVFVLAVLLVHLGMPDLPTSDLAPTDPERPGLLPDPEPTL